MAILDNLLNRIRVGAPLNQDPIRPTDFGGGVTGGTEGFDRTRPPIEILDRPPRDKLPDKRDVDFGCLPDQHWDTNLRRCVSSAPDEPPEDIGRPIEEEGFGRGLDEGCPPGFHKDASGRCVPDSAPPGEDPPFGCPPGQERVNGRCVDIRQEDPDDIGGIGQLPSRYCKKLGRMIPSSQWTVSGCESADPTPPLDDIIDPIGGFKKPIEDTGGDRGTFYDRFPIDYDPSRFGSFQLPPSLEGILDRLGVDIKDKYKKFFADYDIFPESLAGTEFDVGRKGLTADLFNLTRQSQRLRQQQGLLSGAPREFERLGMGATGRQFQALDTAFRKDIFGKRKGFEEETIDRLLDLMKAGADPIVDRPDWWGELSPEQRDLINTFGTFGGGSGNIWGMVGMSKESFLALSLEDMEQVLRDWEESQDREE